MRRTRYQITDRWPARPSRRAMTLVELLVVIVLLSTLVATAIPIISPGGEGRLLREASRNVNAYLQGAQARAIQTGRPFGVALRRLSADTGRGDDNAKCFRLEYVEVPPTYSGFDESSAVRVAANPGYDPFQLLPGSDGDSIGEDDLAPFFLQFVSAGVPTGGLPAGFQPDLLPTRFLRPGDVVEVAGRRFELLSVEGATTTQQVAASGFFELAAGALVRFAAAPVGVALPARQELLPDLSATHDNTGAELPGADSLVFRQALSTPNDPSDDPPSPYWTGPAPYRVFRQPTPAAGEPYELPVGSAIDLQASVFRDASGATQLYNPAVDYDEGEAEFGPRTDPVLLLFSPEGGIQRVHGLVGQAPRTVTGTIALCVGRGEALPAQPLGALADPLEQASFANPVNLDDPALTGLSETDRVEQTNDYNWLNLESRWVIVGGQTGSVETIEGVTPEGLTGAGRASITAQIGAVLENVSNRRRASAN